MIAFCLTRDVTITDSSLYRIHQPVAIHVGAEQRENTGAGKDTAHSLSHIHPFAGWATYNAPMCFLYDDNTYLYTICRAAYSKIWCRLNVISGDEGTIFPLCRLFEVLLLESSPDLFLHLTRIGLQPLTVAFPWMHQAFVYVLEIDQLLLLWDRLFGFQDTYILAVLAAAIFCSKGSYLFQVSDRRCFTSFILFKYLIVCSVP